MLLLHMPQSSTVFYNFEDYITACLSSANMTQFIESSANFAKLLPPPTPFAANKSPIETVPILEVGERTWYSVNTSHVLVVVAWSETWLACTCSLERSTHCTLEIIGTPCRGVYNMSVLVEVRTAAARQKACRE
jgi:hypothetical protein